MRHMICRSIGNSTINYSEEKLMWFWVGTANKKMSLTVAYWPAMKADSLLSIDIKPQPPEKFEYKTPIEMDNNDRSKKILKLHTYVCLNYQGTDIPALSAKVPTNACNSKYFWAKLLLLKCFERLEWKIRKCLFF